MPEAAALLFPVVEDVGAAIGGALGLGGEAAAATAATDLSYLPIEYTAAGDAVTAAETAAAGTSAGAAASGLDALTGTSADYAASLAPGALADAGLGSSVGTSAAAQGLTGTAAQYAGGLAGATPSALTPALSSGLGSAASSAIPTFAQGSVLPLTEQAVEGEVLSPLASQAATSDLSYLPIQQTAAGIPVSATDATAGVGSLGSSGTSVGNALAGGTASPLTPLSGADPSVTSALQPTLNDASSSAAQTFGGQPGQEISKDLSRLGSPAVTNTAVDQAPVAATTTPATPAPPAAAPVAPAAAAPAATEAITPTTDALSSPGGTSTLVKGATDAGGDGLLGDVKSFMKDYGSLALGGAGLAYNMLKGNEPVPYSAQLESQAAQLQSQGAQLQGYLSSGTLPPGIGAALQGAHDSAAASIRAQYASRGMSGSSAEMQDLSNLAQTTVSQGANIASSLLSTGVSEQQFASGLYQNLMAQSVAQDTAMSNAMAGFTNALAGGWAKKQTPTSVGG